jgi:uncharacterized delta-60 repeat protein
MPLTTKQHLSIFVLTTLICTASYVAAQAGSLDTTFGTNGIVATSLRSATSAAIQSDGKIVLAGSAVFNNELADTLLRLNTNGSLDTSFGSGGVANFVPIGTGYTAQGFFAITVQSDGEIVAAAVTTTGTGANIVQVARVETNGTLDPSFGSGGFTATTTIPFTPSNVTGTRALAVAAESNGSILVASSYSNVMARFTSSGQLDTSFGTTGIVNLTNQGPSVTAAPTRIAIDKSDRILVTSGNIPPAPLVQAGTISRYNPNGSLDTTFGTAGTAASVASASALLLETGGKILVAGSLTSKLNAPPAASDVGFGVMRYTTAGVVDKTFGSGGLATADFGANGILSGAFAVAIQSNGEIVAGGAAAQGPTNLSFDSAFALARFTSTGALDTSFGSGGLVTTTLVSGTSNVYSFVNGVLIQSDGKIVAAGNTLVGQGHESGTGAYVARYLAQ